LKYLKRFSLLHIKKSQYQECKGYGLGLLFKNGFSCPVSFIENVLPALFEGKTLAESMVKQMCLGENIINGDPTFLLH